MGGSSVEGEEGGPLAVVVSVKGIGRTAPYIEGCARCWWVFTLLLLVDLLLLADFSDECDASSSGSCLGCTATTVVVTSFFERPMTQSRRESESREAHGTVLRARGVRSVGDGRLGPCFGACAAALYLRAHLGDSGARRAILRRQACGQKK